MSKDKYSVHWDGSEDGGPEVAMPSKKAESGLPDHMLDSHHRTLMDAEAIKGNPHIMKHLRPHMAKKAEDMKKIAGIHEEKITSTDGLRAKAKKMK